MEDLKEMYRELSKEVRSIADRVTRGEQNRTNDREVFQSFKSEEFGAVKNELHAVRVEMKEMRNETIRKHDELRKDNDTKHEELRVGQLALRDLVVEFKEESVARTSQISLVIAKWMGGGLVLLALGQVAINKFF